MPPRPPSFLAQSQSETQTFIPKTRFVGREDILNRFSDMQATPQAADEYRLLNIYGIGGQGKTTLAQQFLKRLQHEREEQGEHITWAAINFDTESYRRDPALALLAIRHQLRAQGIIFPAFDIAFGRYFTLTQQGRDLEAAHPELFHQELEWLSDLEGATGDVLGLLADLTIPGLGAVSKNVGQWNNKSQRWWQSRGIAELLQGLDLLEAYQIPAKLPMYLAHDIYAWLNHEKATQTRRVTLILDSVGSCLSRCMIFSTQKSYF